MPIEDSDQALSTLNEAGFAAQGGGPVPQRRPRSVRRTTAIDIDWPDGMEQEMRFQGSSRDILTGEDMTLTPIEQAWVEARADEARQFSTVRTSQLTEGIPALRGSRGGGKLRGLLREAFPDPAEQLSGHFLLLDDLAGASLVSTWGWLAWTRRFAEHIERAKSNGLGGDAGTMRGVCFGLREGSGALDAEGYPHVGEQNCTRVTELANADDPSGWHMPRQTTGPATRRARWIDVWREGALVHVEGGFQDSALEQDGGRIAVHEYRFTALIEEPGGRIAEITAVPHVLPHRECPAAVHDVRRLIGRPVSDLRIDVPAMFAREAGCTHLNDVLRALVCVPAFAAHLPQ